MVTHILLPTPSQMSVCRDNHFQSFLAKQSREREKITRMTSLHREIHRQYRMYILTYHRHRRHILSYCSFGRQSIQSAHKILLFNYQCNATHHNVCCIYVLHTLTHGVWFGLVHQLMCILVVSLQSESTTTLRQWFAWWCALDLPKFGRTGPTSTGASWFIRRSNCAHRCTFFFRKVKYK